MTALCGANLRPTGNDDDRLWHICIPRGHNAGDTGQRRTRTLRRMGQPFPRSTGMTRHRYLRQCGYGFYSRLRLSSRSDPLSALHDEKPTPPPRGLPATVQLKAMTTTGSAKPPTTGTMSPSRTNGDHGRHEQQSWHCRGQPAPSVRRRAGIRVIQPTQQYLAPVHHQPGHCFGLTTGTPTTAEHHERPVNEIRSTEGPIDPILRIALWLERNVATDSCSTAKSRRPTTGAHSSSSGGQHLGQGPAHRRCRAAGGKRPVQTGRTHVRPL